MSYHEGKFDMTAQDHLERARKHVGAAVDDLSAVVVGRVEGYDDYSEEYQAHVREQFHKLLKMRDEL
jgi:hypothetical protein